MHTRTRAHTHTHTSGIKFIPLRTTGGELIPESGLFVYVNKVEVEEIQSNSLKAARLHRQHGLSQEDDPKTLSTIAEREEVEGALDGVDVMQSINPIELQRRFNPPPNPRPVSSPPLLKTSLSSSETQKKVDKTDLNKVVVVVEVTGDPDPVTGQSDSHTENAQDSISSSKPRSLTIEANPDPNIHIGEDGLPVMEAESELEKEYHLAVHSSSSQSQD